MIIPLHTLIGQDWIDQFSIVTATGVVTVSGLLDRELQSKYVLGVKVISMVDK